MAASTSTAAHSNNNSLYDVFISHRGPDVKKTFASHLYRRLISYGLQVFLDYQELQEGEDLTCQIKGAIRTASLHVAIFSRTYADSQWCLDELVLMLESGAPIIPVFHHVKPTELRRTQDKGAYARSLRNLQQKRKYDSEPRYDSKTIENWRNALSQVAGISGLDLDAFNGDEGELLEKVVDAVFKKGVKTQLNVARYPTGLETKVEDFEKKVLLQQQSGKVQVVGITGFGGVGKTTLAKELFNRKNSNYNKSYFLFDIRENAKKSLHSLQSELLKGLLQRDMDINNKDKGIEMLRKHLSSSQVLLVLDDVDDVEQVHALLTLDVLHHDSLILITSRDKDILARSGVPESSIYKLTGLNTERSRELFCCHAFCQPHPLPGFEDLVNQFLRACDGLPLSLKVFGGLLYGKTDKSYWEDELDELRKTLPYEIQKRLQISYDALQIEEKQIFLDIACFFIGESRDSAIRVWDGSGWKGSRGFQSLLNKCLVEVNFDLKTMEHSIRMHDHLRDLGRELANSSGFPCRLWCGTKDIDDLLQQSSEATKVRGITMLHYYKRASFPRYKMKNLELLDISWGDEDTLKRLLEGVDSPKLLWFRWRYCPSSSLPPYIPMEKLRVLEVKGKDLETLWQEDLQAPSQLRELWINASFRLSKIPKSIGQLKYLERMVVTSFSHYGILEIPKEFCDLRSLKHLVLSITNFSSLPDSFGNLSTLEHINLSSCSGLQRLPDSFGNLSRLEHIDLSDCSSLERLPDSFGNLIKLKYLCLSGCDNLTIPGGTFLKIKLEKMTLPEWRMEVLPRQVVHEWSLEKLLLGTGESSHLEKLVLEAPFLETLPPSFGSDLRNLKYLELQSCRSLKRLPDSFLLLHRLQHLKMQKTQISEISFPTGVCPNLQHLDIRECLDLVEVGTLPDALTNLQLTGCRKLRKIERLCGFAELQTLDASGCEKVEELLSIEGKKETLTESRVQITFSHLDSLFRKCVPRLQLLELESCNTEISEVSFPKGVYPNLQCLFIKHGNSTVEIGKSPNGELIKLKVLNCCNLRKIEEFCGLAKLQILHISSWEGVERLDIWSGEGVDLSRMETLVPLQELQVVGCPNLKSIHGLAHLTHLRELNVSGCSKLQELSGLPHLTQLRELNVSGCSELQELPGLEHLSSLKKLWAYKCVKLKKIKGLEQLTQLRELDVSGCIELEEMPGVGYLQSLVELDVSNCVKLKSLWGLLRLSNLSILEHTGVPMRIFAFDSMS